MDEFSLLNHTFIFENFNICFFVNLCILAALMFMCILWNHPCELSLQNVEMSKAHYLLCCYHLWLLLLSLAALWYVAVWFVVDVPTSWMHMDLVPELSGCVISLKLTERRRQSRGDKQGILGRTQNLLHNYTDFTPMYLVLLMYCHMLLTTHRIHVYIWIYW